MHRRSLRDDAERAGLNAGLDVAGGEAACAIGEPVVEAVADAAGHRGEPGEPRGPHIRRREIRTGEAAVEIGGRYRSLDSEHQPVVLKIIAELAAADHSASSVERQRIRRRKKRRRTQISPPDALHAAAYLAAQIESGPAWRHVRRRGTLPVG